jgi:choline dehydrogenase-like flavoprotein
MARPSPSSSVPLPCISATEFAGRTFDYLIVGGGTAGLVVAARLSEDPAITVGVLEAGSVGIGEPGIDVPGLYGSTLGSKYDWQFATVPQPGLAGRCLPWPRGKVLGGTSALNFMTWNRPSRQDFDAWERLGNVGWGWDGLL